MTVNFRDHLASRRGTLVGTWVKMPTTVSMELMILAGFDFLVVDMEHAPLGLERVHELVGVAHGRGVAVLVRVPDRTPSTISRVLDSGASGVLVPHVETPEDARIVAAASRFPPAGNRGYGPTVRSGQWGRDVAGYRSSSEPLVVPQLESVSAIDNAEGIGTVEGIGALFVGPVDLAVSAGIDPGSTELDDLMTRARDTASRLGLPIGTAVATAEAARAVSDAVDFVLVSNDASLLVNAGADVVSAFRRT